jgi:hypothetical protein
VTTLHALMSACHVFRVECPRKLEPYHPFAAEASKDWRDQMTQKNASKM